MNISKGIAFLLLGAFLIIGFGCAQPPTDEEVVKAIDNSGILKSGGFTVTSPVTVVEKGKKQKDGAWPVKVKLTISMTMMNGETKTIEKTAGFKIYEYKDQSGNRSWTAKLKP